MKKEIRRIRRIRRRIERQHKKLYQIGLRAESELNELSCAEFTNTDGQRLYHFVDMVEIAYCQSDEIIKSLLSAETGKGV